jgi:perosamine synthetase
MKIRLTPRFKPQYSLKEFLAALLPKKDAIEQYERMFSMKFGCKYGIMFPHGRSGLFSLFKVWNLYDTEIICPAYTCVVVQHAIIKSGNIPVFVDCEKNSFNMSYDGIEQAITERTRCIVVTHLFGYPMDVRRIDFIVKNAEKKFANKIYVVQDAAHSYGAKWDNELVTGYGDAAIFGSNISKLINSVFGGMVITNEAMTHQDLRNFRENKFKSVGLRRKLKILMYFFAVNVAFIETVYGMVNWLERKGLLESFVKYYDEGVIDLPRDWDEMPTSVEASIGLVQLAKYDAIIQERRKNSLRIQELLKNDNRFTFPIDDHLGCTYSHLVALVDDRDELVEEYRSRGIQLGILIEYVVPNMKAYLPYKNTEFPVSEYYHTRTINFPIYRSIL